VGAIPPFLLYELMNEQDYKNLIITYQQKSFDLFSQVVALEAKQSTLNQLVKELTEKVEDLSKKLERKNRGTKKQIAANIDSQQF
jgi:predicted RNase H-like nuclease (RuvC/YqgF family)